MPRYVHRGGRFAVAAARLTAQFADEVGITLRTAPRLGEDMSSGAAQLYGEDFVPWTEKRSQVLPGPMIEKQKPRVARLAAASLFGYGEAVNQLPLPSLATPRSKGSGTGSRRRPLSPGAGRGRSLRRAIYPRCFLKKAATGSNDALVERFSLST
jgi:hypothetical protein